MSRLTAPIAWTLSLSLVTTMLPLPAHAALIGTEQAVAPAAQAAAVDSARARLADGLARDDVQAALRARGVDPSQVAARVAALTEDEAAALARHIDRAPAGAGDIVGALVFIFVLLLVTDILGLTKIFPFTRSVR